MGKKYHNGEWLHQEYIEKRRTTTDIADECGVSGATICDWLDRHDIQTRSQRESHKPDKKYTDREWLNTQYRENGKTMREIADECDVTAAAILKWLRRYNIETRDEAYHKRVEPIGITYSKGELGDIPGPYAYAMSSLKVNGEREHYAVGLHQLLAIAKGADPHKVFSDGAYHCHHKNGLRWDNRPSNVELKKAEQHIGDHTQERERNETGEWV